MKRGKEEEKGRKRSKEKTMEQNKLKSFIDQYFLICIYIILTRDQPVVIIFTCQQ